MQLKKLQNSVLVQNFKVLYVFPIFKNKNKNAFSVPTPFSSITKLSKMSTVVSIFSSSTTQSAPHFTETIPGLSYLLIKCTRASNERNKNNTHKKENWGK